MSSIQVLWHFNQISHIHICTFGIASIVNKFVAFTTLICFLDYKYIGSESVSCLKKFEFILMNFTLLHMWVLRSLFLIHSFISNALNLLFNEILLSKLTMPNVVCTTIHMLIVLRSNPI